VTTFFEMELALSPSVPGLGVAELADLCRFAEDLGYRHAWLAEVAGPDAFVLATAAALRTSRMDLGVAVVPAYTRTPAALAMAAASVSQALAGRSFTLGIGSSSETIVSAWHGLSFDRPLTRVVETVQAVRAGLTGDGAFAGATVNMSRFRLAVPPSGPVPIFIGALRPGMLAAAGAHADGVCLNLMPPRVVTRQLEAVREGAAAFGRELPADFGVMARLQTIVTKDLDQAHQFLREQILGPYLAQPVYNQFLSWMGYPEEAAAIASGWLARDRKAVANAIHSRLIDDLALVGSEEVVRHRLEEFAEAGLTVAALMVLAPSRATVEETLRVLAP
jgi:probable F420-dependent oxidoreductase